MMPMDPIDFDNTPVSPRRPSYEYVLEQDLEEPKVTIITPFYNTGSIFHETAISVFKQSFQEWEWIIVNDGSQDPESLSILDEYRKIDARVKIIDLPSNCGLSAARNVGIKNAKTEFIINLDSDDMLEPTAIEKYFWFLVSYPQFAFVEGYNFGFGAQKYLWQGGFHEREKFLLENRVTPNAMFRRSVALNVGGFDEGNRDGLEDWDFWLKCASKGYWGDTIPEYLSWYRRREKHQDRWKNWDGAERQLHFAKLLREWYPGLWRQGLPKVFRHPAQPYHDVCEQLPAKNVLKASKNRLLIITAWLEMGGADKFNLDILRELTSRYDYEVTIVTTVPGNHSWYYEFAKYTPDIFILDHFLHLSDYPRFIRYLIQSRQIQTVLIANSELAYHLLPYLRSHFPDVSFIDCLHMEQEDWKGGGYPRLSIISQSQLNLTIVTSEYLRQWMINRGAGASKIRVCYTSIDPDDWNPERFNKNEIRQQIGVSQSDIVILYAGRLVEQKQPILAAKVFLRLKQLGVPFIGLIAGDGPLFNTLKSFLGRHHINEVKLLGPVSNKRMRELLAISDIFFLPSQHEGISLAIYEAMAMGVTVVGADVSGQKELVTPECGILVPRGPSELENYVQALNFLIYNAEERQAMARQARERVMKYFRLDQMVEQMIKLFNEDAQSSSAPNSIDVSLAREIAIRALEFTRLEWAWPRFGNRGNSLADIASMYSFRTLVNVLVWKILNKITSFVVWKVSKGQES
ncbi:MAG: glycosyltransferase [Gloeomargarita sp. GMQP_bins_120]